MATKIETVYPSTSSFSGSSQLNLGPFVSGTVNKLLRAEVRGQVNFQASSVSATGVTANFQLWGVQWVPTGNAALDVVTSADGPNWLMREQLGSDDLIAAWAPTSGPGVVLGALRLRSFWAGQLPVSAAIDFWLSLRAPTGVSIANENLFASLRWWWT